MAVQLAAEEAAIANISDPIDKAKALLEHFGLVKADEARGLLQGAEAAAKAAKDEKRQALAANVLIDISLAKKDFEDALVLANRVVDVYSAKGQKAKALTMVAGVQQQRGDPQSAMAAYRQAQTLYSDAGDKDGVATALSYMSQVQLELGDAQDAVRIAREAVSTSSKAAANAMLTLAQVELAEGNVEAAITQATEVIGVCKDTSDKHGEGAGKLVLANSILAMDGTSMEGIQCGKDALTLFQEVHDVYGSSGALHTLANAYFARGDLEEGLKCAREALACYRQLGDANNQEVVRNSIEEARMMTQEMRKTVPKRPYVLPASAITPPHTGPLRCSIPSHVPADYTDVAVSGRKYWGKPDMVEADPGNYLERPPNHSIIWGHFMSDHSTSQICVEFNNLVVSMAKGEVCKIPIVVLTRGNYGRQAGEMTPANMTDIAGVAVWGLVRTARQEVPTITMQLLDFSHGLTSAEIPRCIRPALPESAYYNRCRWEPQIAAVPSLFRRELRRDALTGGGGGHKDSKESKFMRKSFNWTGPSHKMDYCWFRQEWKACGPMLADVGTMPPNPPCLAVRTG